MKQIRVVQYGFGSLGVEIFQALQKNKKIKLVGVIDIDKSKIGKDCGLLVNKKRNGIKISKKLDDIKSKSDIIIHATTSSIEKAYSQFQAIATKKISIISTCEELVYPFGKNKKIAKKIDNLAKRKQMNVLGIGVNPGFLMDSILLMTSSLCSKINKITVSRVVNLAKRRTALQKKMCVGLSLKEFNEIKTNSGHVGLEESAMMIADSLKIKVKLVKKIKPVIAKKNLRSNRIMIKRGSVSGICQKLIAKNKGVKFLEMNLNMYVGAKEYDLIDIKGIPPVYIETNGINGDRSTAALLSNYIPIILKTKSGLHTVNKLPIPSFAS